MSTFPLPQPFALAAAEFPFRALTAAAGRAALGGPRESLMGVLMGVRLAAAAAAPGALAQAGRLQRAEAAKGWLSALALPAKTRTALLRLFAASAGDDPVALGDALEAVIEVTAPNLPRAARSEVSRLADQLRQAGGAGLPGVVRHP